MSPASTITGPFRIATRESKLALWQANHVRALIERAFPDINVEICGMTTEGDRNKTSPLSRLGGKGVFVKELEVALMEGTADIAVHSMKDVPVVLPEGLGIHAICEREDPRDAFVSNRYASFADLPTGARVGTSSLRRKLQVQSAFPDLEYPELRGNVDTRLGKLDDGEYDAIILATAGLKRLGFEHRVTEKIPVHVCLPAAGQGAVGIECASDRDDVIAVLSSINHAPTAIRVHAERMVSKGLGANCTLPIAAYAEIDGDEITLSAFVSDLSGANVIREAGSGNVNDAGAIAERIVSALVDRGALGLIESD